eukprot:scaffold876_cov243-Pinguiococcus_pyrenoidosus.AAC.7
MSLLFRAVHFEKSKKWFGVRVSGFRGRSENPSVISDADISRFATELRLENLHLLRNITAQGASSSLFSLPLSLRLSLLRRFSAKPFVGVCVKQDQRAEPLRLALQSSCLT